MKNKVHLTQALDIGREYVDFLRPHCDRSPHASNAGMGKGARTMSRSRADFISRKEYAAAKKEAKRIMRAILRRFDNEDASHIAYEVWMEQSAKRDKEGVF